MALNVMKHITGIGRASFAVVGLLLAAVLPLGALAQSEDISPAARHLLKASTDFLACQQQFSVDTESSIEVVSSTIPPGCRSSVPTSCGRSAPEIWSTRCSTTTGSR